MLVYIVFDGRVHVIDVDGTMSGKKGSLANIHEWLVTASYLTIRVKRNPLCLERRQAT